ncbi:MAG: hypothetical protein K9L64_05950 [Candidatus Izimaplasma sp.]|nr:hypothetical protein [Candidatus Izimaplasma bacterium]
MDTNIKLSKKTMLDLEKVNTLVKKNYKIHNTAYLVLRLGWLLCRLVITLPIGILFVLIGWIILLIKVASSKKAIKLGDIILKKLIFTYGIVDFLELQNYLDENFVFHRISYLLKKDKEFLNFSLDETKTILQK